MIKLNYRILLVDDDEGDCRLVTEYLSKAKRVNFQVDHIDNLYDAQLHLTVDSHDAYLVDYHLGESTGLELIRMAHDQECEAPIIVITGIDSDDLDSRVMEAGAADYIPKDQLSPAILDRSIRHAIERRKYIRELEHMANRDALTQLGNRSMFEDALERAVSLAKRRATGFAVLLLDLDRFKDINDTLGHNVGDILLALVAKRIQKVTRKEDIVARIGGDEFTVLLTDTNTKEEAEVVAKKILEIMIQPTPINNSNLIISTSIGIAVYPNSGITPVTIMQNADMALYKAKAQGKNNYQFFTEELQERLHKELTIEKALRTAIFKKELSLHYQCQVDLSNSKITGFEALLRWNSAEFGNIPPADFIPIAEKTGLIDQIGLWVLKTACQQLRDWHNLGHTHLSMSINVSPVQLKSRHFLKNAKAAMIEFKIPLNMLEFEVTEAVIVNNNDNNLEIFHRIRGYGIRLAIDDFGTGYSSLSYLQNFPINRLKIDRSFISDKHMGRRESTITQTIITLGKGLNMTVLAEGVETESQMRLLISQGCDQAQGFLYSRPITASEASKLIVDGIEYSSDKIHQTK